MFYLQERKFVKCFKLHDECKTDEIIKHEIEKNSTSTRFFVNPDYLMNMDGNFSWNWINLTFSDCKYRILRVVFREITLHKFIFCFSSQFFTFFFKNVFVYNFADARSWSLHKRLRRTPGKFKEINKQILSSSRKFGLWFCAFVTLFSVPRSGDLSPNPRNWDLAWRQNFVGIANEIWNIL